MAAVGEHASSQELQLLPWSQGEAFLCCSKIFNAWLNQRGGIGAFEVTQVIDRLVHFITEHGNSRFENSWGLEKEVNSEAEENKAHIEKTINRVGFRKLIEDRWVHYFDPSAFDKEILQGGDKKTLLKALASKGVFVTALEKAKDGIEITRYTISTRVPGFGQKRLYQISRRMLEKFSDSAL
jgi:putative DNA primase/helicase